VVGLPAHFLGNEGVYDAMLLPEMSLHKFSEMMYITTGNRV